MRIELGNEALDLGQDLTLDIEEKSPVMNDRGSQTLPVTLPCTPRNRRLTGFAHRLDTDNLPHGAMSRCRVVSGAFVRSGTVNIVSAGLEEGVTLNIGFDNSEAYSRWRQLKLSELPCPVETYGSAHELCEHIKEVFASGSQSNFPYAVFEVMTSNEGVTEGGTTVYYPQYLNRLKVTRTLQSGRHAYSIVTEAREERQVCDGKVVSMRLPEGYGVAPFLYAWKALDIIFSALGYTLNENVMRTDHQLSRVCVLNNASDCCVTGKLDMRELMPDCTVEEFLGAMYARFGMVYAIDGDSRTARVSLIRDVVGSSSVTDLTERVCRHPLINYEKSRQVKLSAGTSFDGAAPGAERYEDFTRGAAVARVTRFGDHQNIYLIQEKPTGRWYKWDESAGKMQFVGSSHFIWDRQTEGVEDMDITSVDESVPMVWDGNLPIPCYLAGNAHRHTYVRTGNTGETKGDTTGTPLSLCLALPVLDTADEDPVVGGTVMPWRWNGERAEVDGQEFAFSLTWQGSDGLFATFWKDYDAILRHAWHKIETEARLPQHAIARTDMLSTVTLSGQRLLIDTMAYTLPSERETLVRLALRSLRLIGAEGLDKEQGIPGTGNDSGLTWVIVSSTLYTVAAGMAESYRARAEQSMKSDYGPSWQTGDAILQRQQFIHTGTTPETDMEVKNMIPSREGEQLQKQYRCEIQAEVWVWGYDPGGSYYEETVWMYDEVTYSVIFEAMSY